MLRADAILLALVLLLPLPLGQACAANPSGAGETTVSTADLQTEDALPRIQERWAEIRYQLAEPQRAAAYAELASDIASERQSAPADLRLAVWEGIVLASQAGAQGGFAALGLAKRAKADFEAVIAADGSVLDGSAYTSLGSLYYQVPGWPLGFGDDDQAAKLLAQGLAAAPDGIDANYFYGDFLLEQKRYAEAVRVLEHALEAPDRPGRASADAGRRTEIREALERARARLH